MSDPPSADDWVRAAAVLRQAGDLDQADALCERALRASPDHPEALHLKGVMALARGRLPEAIDLIEQAVRARPEDVGGQADLGVALARAGRRQEALAAYARAIELQPAHAGVQFNRANLLAGLGRLDDALAGYDAAIAAAPAYAQAWANRAAVLTALGRPAEALNSHGQVVALDPQSAGAHFNLAAALQAGGRLDEAVEAYAQAGRLDPALTAAHVQNAGLLLALKRPEEVLLACDQALAGDPGQAGVWSNRGAALLAMARPGEALAAFDRAVMLDPTLPQGHANRGAALRELNRLPEALASFEHALALAPDYLEARCNQGVSQLLAGDLEAGFAGHEQRWRIEPGLSERRDFAAPLWLGQEDVAGKTVLLHAEQGFGDTINFCRYAALLADCGARVVMEVQPQLKTAMAGLAGVSQLVGRGEALPEFDYHCPLMSLPLAFGTRLDTIPAPAAYLAAPADREAAWAAPIGPAKALRVGVIWSGKPTHHNDRNRSIPLERFLRALPANVEVFSLHDRVRNADEAVLEAHPHIRRFDGQIADFADTAALATAMDLVVSVDTSAAHLAAALGRPTWVLLPFAPDWRWLLGREDSPWYPSVRLFRQPAVGDWDSVLDRVRSELEALSPA